jgi:hypothetical protein
MKTAFNLAVLAVLLVAPGECFADWMIKSVTKDRAREMGMEVRSVATGPNLVRVELEFKVEGELKEYDGRMKDRSRVELRIGEGDNPQVSAPLREDRSKPGRVVVRFTADRAQLDKLTLWVMVPGTLGGDIYDLRVKDFVEREKGH